MAEGYVKLHRQLLDSYQFSNPENLKIWIWFLLKANYKDKTVSLNVGKGYSDVIVKRGQFIFGRNSAAIELKMHESKIYRAIKKFENDGSISVKSNNKYSIITICKYDDYNSFENETEQQVNNRRTTGEQQVNTTNKEKKDKKGEEQLDIPFSGDCLTIVNYLNEKAETSYKSTTKATVSLIKLRMKEGFTTENFKSVIDLKTKQWLRDNKMKQYLCPTTLFGGKFESYLENCTKVVKLDPQALTAPMSDAEYEEFMRPTKQNA